MPAARQPLLAVLGPTASGKSNLAECLALRANGELINSDASAVYQELSVGVTKPDQADRQKYSYHCLDLASLESGFDLMEYLLQAESAIQDILFRNRLPIVVGGSGLYARALLDGYRPPTLLVPAELREEVRSMPPETALQRLCTIDPDAFQRIDRMNPRRVCRALELALVNNGPVPEPVRVERNDLRILRFILLPSRKILRTRIAGRAEKMWEPWVKEVDLLEKNGLTRWLDLRKPIGYSWVLAYIRGELDRDEAVANIVQQTFKLAKKQQTWLKKEADHQFCHKLHLDCEEQWSDLPEIAWQRLQEFLSS